MLVIGKEGYGNNMHVTIFLSVLSTHQLGLCNAFYKVLGEDFKAVFFEKLPQYRKDAGFVDLSNQFPYCIEAPRGEDVSDKEQIDFVRKIVDDSDVGIVGSAPNYIFDLFIENGKKRFLYSERFYKKGHLAKICSENVSQG